MSYSPNDIYEKNSTSLDAWGRPKVYADFNLFKGLWNLDIPQSLWRIYENNTLIVLNRNSTRVISGIDTGLSVKSGSTIGNNAYIISKRSPSYQPNKGHLYSTSVSLPNPTANGIREWGLFNDMNGVFFRLKSDGKIYAVIRSNGAEIIEKEIIPEDGFDYDNFICDINFQWRGFGDYFFHLKNEETGKIYKTLTIDKSELAEFPINKVSIADPNLPSQYRCTNLGDEVEMISGCITIDSEGGSRNETQGRSIATDDESTISGDSAVMAIRIPETYNGRINTRDIILSAITTSCDDESLVSFYYSTDANDFSGTIWSDLNGVGNIQYSEKSNISFDLNNNNAERTFRTRVEQDFNFVKTNPSSRSERYLTAGDYFVVFIRPVANSKLAYVTIELDEEI